MSLPSRPIEVGLRVPRGLFAAGVDAVAAYAAAVEDAGLDRLWIGDHISFRGGQGYDGLIQATALASLTRRVMVQTAVYLLPLRHPLAVARQVASVAELAPGRLVFGVGVGGDDPAEVTNSGVELRSRGRRMDESLGIVRRLLAGEVVDHHGEHFHLDGASIVPTPAPAVPVVVGGRSDAALRRAGRLAEGWLGVWVSPQRFDSSVATVAEAAAEAGRGDTAWQHGLLVWCGFAESTAAARPALAGAMEDLYQMPFERFAATSPHGTPEQVTAALLPYVEAGVSTFLLAAVADDPKAAVAAAAEVRSRLRGAG
jgi:alkanesulfonate monooxygenase SsuD/methylene tetrahydromethanopterin reductase-like flavin-dependent oxidoreductase (luciferase family)